MENTSALVAGSELQNKKYSIKKVLSQGGFGITYLADFVDMQTHVAIKECFLSGYCVRQSEKNTISLQSIALQDFSSFKTRFKAEAQTLFQFRNHPNIVHVTDVFEENNTAYYVMDFIEGQTLEYVIKKQGRLGYDIAMNYIGQLCDAVKAIHDKNIIHQDIKPANIMITPDNRVVLIDFGSAKEFITSHTRSTLAIITPGYAPEEQYSTKREKGRYTDIYAIGATLYYCLTAEVPLESIDRRSFPLKEPGTLNLTVSNTVNNAILKAMAIESADRYQTVTAFFNDLTKITDRDTEDDEKTRRIDAVDDDRRVSDQKSQSTNDEPDSIRKTKSRKYWWLFGILGIIIIAVIIKYYSSDRKEELTKVDSIPNADSIALIEKQKQDSLDEIEKHKKEMETKPNDKPYSNEVISEESKPVQVVKEFLNDLADHKMSEAYALQNNPKWKNFNTFHDGFGTMEKVDIREADVISNLDDIVKVGIRVYVKDKTTGSGLTYYNQTYVLKAFDGEWLITSMSAKIIE